MARTFVEAHMDFPAIEAKLAGLEAPTITTDEAVDRVSPGIVAADRRGVTHEQIRDALKEHGIIVSLSAIGRIAKGAETPAPRKARAARPAKGETKDPSPPPPAGAEQGTLV